MRVTLSWDHDGIRWYTPGWVYPSCGIICRILATRNVSDSIHQKGYNCLCKSHMLVDVETMNNYSKLETFCPLNMRCYNEYVHHFPRGFPGWMFIYRVKGFKDSCSKNMRGSSDTMSQKLNGTFENSQQRLESTNSTIFGTCSDGVKLMSISVFSQCLASVIHRKYQLQ